MLALIETGCIAVPLTSSVAAKKAEFMAIAGVEALLELDARDEARLTRFERPEAHEIVQRLRKRGHPGLVLFSSGSTGQSKAAVHDIVGMLAKFKVRRHARRAITFLLYDHIGGFNTMLYQLSNAGCIVTVQDRDPDTVLRAVERHKVELLPTSPTFINLILLSEAYRRYDLSSLKIVTYGTEPMPESTLRRFHQVLPNVELQQTYGLSEVGILRSKSRSSDSLWVKLGGEGFQTRVVDGILQIKAESAMLGYLNAPSPFTDDGWFNTGDKVEVDGDYFRILGRQSEIINVGGQKVYPAQVESVVQEMPEVAEVSVYGEKNAIMGQIVCAAIRLRQSRDARAVPSRAQAVLPAAAPGVSDSGPSQAGGKCDARRTLQKESAGIRGQADEVQARQRLRVSTSRWRSSKLNLPGAFLRTIFASKWWDHRFSVPQRRAQCYC